MAQPIPAKAKTPAEYTNTRASLVKAFGLTFLPYETKAIPEAYADPERLKAHVLIRSGILSPGKVAPPPPMATSRPVSLVDLDDAKAIAYVKTETDLETLSEWAKAEASGPKRKAILDALSEQASSLSATK